MFSFLKKLPELFPKCLYQLTVPPAAYESPGYSTDYSPVYGVVSPFNFSCPGGYVLYLIVALI